MYALQLSVLFYLERLPSAACMVHGIAQARCFPRVLRIIIGQVLWHYSCLIGVFMAARENRNSEYVMAELRLTGVCEWWHWVNGFTLLAAKHQPLISKKVATECWMLLVRGKKYEIIARNNSNLYCYQYFNVKAKNLALKVDDIQLVNTLSNNEYILLKGPSMRKIGHQCSTHCIIQLQVHTSIV